MGWRWAPAPMCDFLVLMPASPPCRRIVRIGNWGGAWHSLIGAAVGDQGLAQRHEVGKPAGKGSPEPTRLSEGIVPILPSLEGGDGGGCRAISVSRKSRSHKDTKPVLSQSKGHE